MTESERERETLRGEEVELSGESKQGGREGGRPSFLDCGRGADADFDTHV